MCVPFESERIIGIACLWRDDVKFLKIGASLSFTAGYSDEISGAGEKIMYAYGKLAR